MNTLHTRPLQAIREEIASFEFDFMKALSIRTKIHPLNSGLYLEEKPLGLSQFDKRLYRKELTRALRGEYRNGETPMSSLPLPFSRMPKRVMVQRVRRAYIDSLGELCTDREDKPREYAKSFDLDLNAMYFLWQRITRAGKQVGRRKLEDSPAKVRAKYEKAIKNRDLPSMINLLRDPTQEEKVIQRVKENALTLDLNPNVLENLFRRAVMPTTLELEAYDLIENAQ
jgi:chorismate mutase